MQEAIRNFLNYLCTVTNLMRCSLNFKTPHDFDIEMRMGFLCEVPGWFIYGYGYFMSRQQVFLRFEIHPPFAIIVHRAFIKKISRTRIMQDRGFTRDPFMFSAFMTSIHFFSSPGRMEKRGTSVLFFSLPEYFFEAILLEIGCSVSGDEKPCTSVFAFLIIPSCISDHKYNANRYTERKSRLF